MRNIIALIIITNTIFIGCTQNYANVTFINKNEQMVQNLKVGLSDSDQSFIFVNIAQGDSVTMQFADFADSGYKLSLILNDSTTIDEKLGYVTSGFNFTDDIILNKESKLILKRRIVDDNKKRD